MDGRDLDAVVAGCIGIDTNIYLYGHDVDWTVEANFTQNLDYVGQAGGYSSRLFASLGCRTAFVGAVGEDLLGELVRRELAADGIETVLFRDPLGTHRSVNLMYPDGRRKNFYDGKGQMDVQPDLDACRRLLARTRLVHVHLENWCRHLLPVAREHGVVVSCDLQDVVDLEDTYRRDFVEGADILFFSCVNFPDPRPALDHLRRGRPGRTVVGGRGADGCVVADDAGIRFFPPVALPAPVIDTNGAGDALAVGFLTSLVLDGFPVDAALLRGQTAARHVCTRKATSTRLLTRPELEARCLARPPGV
ncbi:MAG TPA: carbohydrate kinase family protein [Thermoanaerobaculaceae bacterium]|nr:carbohydrate kinase family protein [Thermoanaerobaculaceae bacterium]